MSAQAQRFTKRQKRLHEKGIQKIPTLQKQHFELKRIDPKTENQSLVFEAYSQGAHLFLHGAAGTGKTFLAVYLALKEILDMRSERNRLVIIRSALPTRNQGFLPGDLKEKAAVYELPYRAICAELFHRDDAYEILKQKGIIEFETTSFLRGVTINDAIVLFDENQNSSYTEHRTVISRLGNESRLILCGDTKQDDLTSERYNEESGLSKMMHVFDEMQDIETIEFSVQDIVRSGFVRDFLEAEYRLGY